MSTHLELERVCRERDEAKETLALLLYFEPSLKKYVAELTTATYSPHLGDWVWDSEWDLDGLRAAKAAQQILADAEKYPAPTDPKETKK